MGLPKGIPNKILYLLMEEPEKFCERAIKQVREKITNHKSNCDEYQRKNKKKKINLNCIPKNFKILFAYSKFKTIEGEKIMTGKYLME